MLEITTQIYLANFVPLIVALAKLTYIIVPAVEDSRCGLCPVSLLDQSTGDHVEKGEGGGLGNTGTEAPQMKGCLALLFLVFDGYTICKLKKTCLMYEKWVDERWCPANGKFVRRRGRQGAKFSNDDAERRNEKCVVQILSFPRAGTLKIYIFM